MPFAGTMPLCTTHMFYRLPFGVAPARRSENKTSEKVIAEKVAGKTIRKRLLVRVPKAKARRKTAEAKARPKTPVAMLKPTVTPGEVGMILRGVADFREAWRIAMIKPTSTPEELAIFLEKHIILKEAWQAINWRARPGVWQHLVNNWPTLGTDAVEEDAIEELN